jgi:N-ethylmaleimide reductase
MTSTSSPTLFDPVRIGAIDCSNRIVMAPLTRCRAAPDTLALGPLNAEYYAQRASAGLIVSEATQVEPRGVGYVGTPGIYSDAQREGWRQVADAVHAAGGRIVAQLWHVGSVSHPDLQPDNALPISASAWPQPGTVHTPQGKRDRVPPRALEAHEIPELVEAFRRGARIAREAGLDGVEIHGANGYLIEQFMRDSTNSRTDAWGGSVMNRLRFCLEIVDACVAEFGKDRVGIRLSPVSNANGCPSDSNPQATYGTLIEELTRRQIAFVHFIEGNTGAAHFTEGFDFAGARRRFGGTTIANNKYSRQMAIDALATGWADAVAFGVPFISNPDLVERLRLDAPINPANTKTYYGPGPIGYTDYPTLAQEALAAKGS